MYQANANLEVQTHFFHNYTLETSNEYVFFPKALFCGKVLDEFFKYLWLSQDHCRLRKAKSAVRRDFLLLSHFKKPVEFLRLRSQVRVFYLKSFFKRNDYGCSVWKGTLIGPKCQKMSSTLTILDLQVHVFTILFSGCFLSSSLCTDFL